MPIKRVTLEPHDDGDGRIIIVGDIHGCIDQLNGLLRKVNFDVKRHDRLVLVGDLVNKGPDSVAVVQRAMDLGAVSVMGNHEAALLRRIEWLQKEEQRQLLKKKEAAAAASGVEATGKDSEATGDAAGACDDEDGKKQPTYRADDPILQLAANFPASCYHYIKNLPYIIEIPQYQVLVVHAGVNPSRGLDDQEPWELMHMRRVTSDGRGLETWNNNHGYQWVKKWHGFFPSPSSSSSPSSSQPPQSHHRVHVVFGHDARTGLQRERYATGLDTGCCYGGELTAMVLPGHTIVSVPRNEGQLASAGVGRDDFRGNRPDCAHVMAAGIWLQHQQQQLRQEEEREKSEQRDKERVIQLVERQEQKNKQRQKQEEKNHRPDENGGDPHPQTPTSVSTILVHLIDILDTGMAMLCAPVMITPISRSSHLSKDHAVGDAAAAAAADNASSSSLSSVDTTGAVAGSMMMMMVPQFRSKDIRLWCRLRLRKPDPDGNDGTAGVGVSDLSRPRGVKPSESRIKRRRRSSTALVNKDSDENEQQDDSMVAFAVDGEGSSSSSSSPSVMQRSNTDVISAACFANPSRSDTFEETSMPWRKFDRVTVDISSSPHHPYDDNTVNFGSSVRTSWTTTGPGFLSFCGCLVSVDLRRTHLLIASDFFLSDCRGLTEVRLPDTLSAVDDFCLLECTSLVSIDLSNTKLARTGRGFMSGCENLTAVDLPRTLSAVSDAFLSQCSSLVTIDLEHSELTEMGDQFLAQCPSLRDVRLPLAISSFSVIPTPPGTTDTHTEDKDIDVNTE